MKKRVLGKAFLSFLCGSFVALNAQAQFPEGFESSVPPTGWIIMDNGNGLAQFWQPSATAYAGAQSAYVRYESVPSGLAEDWLVTPGFTVTAGATALSFYQRQQFTTDYGSVYTVRLSTTDQTTMGNFTTIDTQVETDFSTNWVQRTLDLSAYVGQTVYVAWVMTNNDGDNWYIDDVNLTAPPCVAPNTLTATNITTTSADLSWIPFGSGTNFNVAVLPNGAPAPTSGTAVTGTTYAASGLTQATLYDFYVQEVCSNTEPLIISGIFDGPITGGIPKGVELYVAEDIPDMSIYGISSVTNGGGATGTPEFVFPAVSYTAGTYIYVSSDSAGFYDYFGVQTTYNIGGIMLINGDDAIELFKNGAVIDVYGDVNVDGTGTPWEYLDGWAYRNNGSVTNGGTFVVGDWTYSGINATDGCATNGSCGSVQPIGTFFTSDDVSPWAMITFQTDCGVLMGDDSLNAIVIPALPFVDSVNTAICYTDQINNGAPDVFYMYVIDNCIDSIDIELCGSSFDTYLWVYDELNNLIADNDDNCGLQSAIYGLDITAYDTLYIIAEGYASSSGEIYLNINPVSMLPAPALLSQTDVICGGESTGSATFGGGGAGISYLWDASAGSQTDSVGVGLSAGTYYVTASYASGCEYIDSVTIIDLNPEIVLTAVATDETFGNDGSIDLTVTGGSGSYTYAWDNGAGTSEDPSGLGGNMTYTVIVTDVNNCSDTLSVYVGSMIGLENVELNAPFSVFPNPNSGQFTVTMSENKAVRMDIINALGQQVSSQELTATETQINIRNLDKGTYTLRFTLQTGKTAFARVVLM